MVGPGIGLGKFVLGKIMHGGSGLVATTSSYLGLAWLADLLFEDSENQEFPTYWLIVLAAAPAVLTLLCLYTFHWWRMERQRRQEMAHQVQYLPHNRANPVQFHIPEIQNGLDPRAEYARVARPHMGRDPLRQATLNTTNMHTQTRGSEEPRTPSPIRNIIIPPFRC
ncbi:hypothetical protein DdX_09700 [Ditylenchus destructor]|uniref:Uncharacterized protein n=1 Tax=Ditylenchus destructor TaxID=166010 RepID=A0AAD4N0D0_9BILA|nr:hypothetical protein DdX_09700 [Ditylenchus destructor]